MEDELSQCHLWMNITGKGSSLAQKHINIGVLSGLFQNKTTGAREMTRNAY